MPARWLAQDALRLAAFAIACNMLNQGDLRMLVEDRQSNVLSARAEPGAPFRSAPCAAGMLHGADRPAGI